MPIPTPHSAADYELFLALFTKCQGRLQAFIRALVHDPTQADDVFQATSLVLWRSFATSSTERSTFDGTPSALPMPRNASSPSSMSATSGFTVQDLRAVGFARAPTLTLGALPAIGTSVPQRFEYESGADFAVWFSSGALPAPLFRHQRGGNH
jgi:hypothetical protein